MTRKRLLLSCQGARTAELIASRRCTWWASVLVLKAEQFSSWKIRSCQAFSCVDWPSTYTLRRQPKFYWDSLVQYRLFEDYGESAYGALRKSIDCQTSRGFTCQLRKFSFEKKKPIGQSKIKEPSERERFLQEDATADRRTGEGGKTWASFTVFSTAKCMKKAAARSGCPSLIQTLIIQLVYSRRTLTFIFKIHGCLLDLRKYDSCEKCDHDSRKGHGAPCVRDHLSGGSLGGSERGRVKVLQWQGTSINQILRMNSPIASSHIKACRVLGTLLRICFGSTWFCAFFHSDVLHFNFWIYRNAVYCNLTKFRCSFIFGGQWFLPIINRHLNEKYALSGHSGIHGHQNLYETQPPWLLATEMLKHWKFEKLEYIIFSSPFFWNRFIHWVKL